jgi:hypothetical protein
VPQGERRLQLNFRIGIERQPADFRSKRFSLRSQLDRVSADARVNISERAANGRVA